MTASLVYPRLAGAQLAARWRELLSQPGLPHLFELDQYGELIETNPPKTPHQRIVYALSGRIRFFGAEGERMHSALGLTLALPPGTYPPLR